MLHERLGRLGRSGIAIVLKIETRQGFENLPRLLLEGLRRPPLAVMIARGDLAVEVGFERLAELQESEPRDVVRVSGIATPQGGRSGADWLAQARCSGRCTSASKVQRCCAVVPTNRRGAS